MGSAEAEDLLGGLPVRRDGVLRAWSSKRPRHRSCHGRPVTWPCGCRTGATSSVSRLPGCRELQRAPGRPIYGWLQ